MIAAVFTSIFGGFPRDYGSLSGVKVGWGTLFQPPQKICPPLTCDYGVCVGITREFIKKSGGQKRISVDRGKIGMEGDEWGELEYNSGNQIERRALLVTAPAWSHDIGGRTT